MVRGRFSVSRGGRPAPERVLDQYQVVLVQYVTWSEVPGVTFTKPCPHVYSEARS